MKSKKRRSTHCSNCESALEESYNFCPTCGQSNTDNNITFSILIREFLDNYLGVDSKMANSIMPFLFSPGKLTNRFQDGKIKHFIHPVRLYLVLSVVYFFVVSHLLSFDLRELGDDSFNIPARADIEELRNDPDFAILTDSLKIEALNDSLVRQFIGINNFNVLYDSLVSRYDSAIINNTEVALNAVDLIAINEDEHFLDKTNRWARDRHLSDDDFMDSLMGGKGRYKIFNVTDTTSSEDARHLKSQVRKVFKNEEGFKGFILGNLPIMMFLLIPLFALVLKVVYARRNHLYIKHIVHALHVHSFAYFMYAISLLVIFKLLVGHVQWQWIVGITTFIGVSTYVYISFLNVYKQGWFKTLVKFNIVGFIYIILLQIFFSFEIFMSFWYY
ncbi:DUF3667 domain-containing protein [uncultured Roseivirga sp.]|uniref:DUF3667 domain-containing protein n=1 Tax=uncultured Roseivirga sp. TaxID=543088 RepID=UPI0030DBFDBF